METRVRGKPLTPMRGASHAPLMRRTLRVPGPIDLETTFMCGQAFRWRREEGAWSGVVAGAEVLVRSAGPSSLDVSTRGADPGAAALVRYFRLDEDPREHLAGAEELLALPGFAALLGLRLLRQDPWETLITFICSAAANVRKITGCVEGISARWGETIPGSVRRRFPGPERLAKAGDAELRALGLGFRAPYVRETARLVRAGALDWAALRHAELADARATLCRLPGVGPKVADCVLLFSLDHVAAYPVDRWIRRATLELSARPRARDAELARWAERLGPGRGYLQQLLFHLRRTGGPLPPLPRAGARRRSA
jgi:N-glycosylase/DNA lyase